MTLFQLRKVEGVKVQIMEFQKIIILINCQNSSGKSKKFYSSRMTKRTVPLSSSREI